MFGVVLLVTFIMPVICNWEATYIYIVELMSTSDGQIMETLDDVGIKLFVLAALKEH